MPTYDSTLGAFVIGSLISSALFGLFTCQVYVYNKTFPGESKWIRWGLVNTMWVIELAHTICTSHSVYFYAVTHFGDAEALFLAIPISLPVSLLFHSMITVLAQSYYSYRIARFSSNIRYPYIIPAVCCIFTFCILMGDIAVAAMEALIYTGKYSIETYFEKMEWLVVTPLVLRCSVDVIISVTMVYYLRQQRTTSAYRNTIAVVDKLILWAIETGVVTSLVGIALLICFLASRSTYVWVALTMILPKIFSNAMLANMNSRVTLRQMQSTMIVGSEFGIQMGDPTSLTQSIRFQPAQVTQTDTSSIFPHILTATESTKISDTETMV